MSYKCQHYVYWVHFKPQKYLNSVFSIMFGSEVEFVISRSSIVWKAPRFIRVCSFSRNCFVSFFPFIRSFLQHIPHFISITYQHAPKKTFRVNSCNEQDRVKNSVIMWLFYRKGVRYEIASWFIMMVEKHRMTLPFFTHDPQPVHLTAFMSHIYIVTIFWYPSFRS